jgi:hypothetical protein
MDKRVHARNMNPPSSQRRPARIQNPARSHQNQHPRRIRRRLLWTTVTSTALVTVVTVFASGFSTAIATQVGGFFSSPEAPRVTSTDVRYVRLFDEEGRPAAGFTEDPRTRTHGKCWESSIVSEDPGAYRCIDGRSGSYLYDPCWEVRPAHNLVGCVEDPWSRRIILVHLSSEPSYGRPPRAVDPWGLEVQDPIDSWNFLRCTFQGGVSSPIGGQPTPWECKDEEGRHTGWIIGKVDTQASLWWVYYAADGSDAIVRATVRTAWK